MMGTGHQRFTTSVALLGALLVGALHSLLVDHTMTAGGTVVHATEQREHAHSHDEVSLCDDERAPINGDSDVVLHSSVPSVALPKVLGLLPHASAMRRPVQSEPSGRTPLSWAPKASPPV